MKTRAALLSLVLVSASLATERPAIESIHELDAQGNVTNVIVDGRSLSPEEQREHLAGFGGFGMVITTNQQGVVVLRVPDETPAKKAGIAAGDIIVFVDNTPLAGLSIKEAVKIFWGLPGSTAQLLVLREGQSNTVQVSVVREIIRARQMKSVEPAGGAYVSPAAGDPSAHP